METAAERLAEGARATPRRPIGPGSPARDFGGAETAAFPAALEPDPLDLTDRVYRALSTGQSDGQHGLIGPGLRGEEQHGEKQQAK